MGVQFGTSKVIGPQIGVLVIWLVWFGLISTAQAQVLPLPSDATTPRKPKPAPSTQEDPSELLIRSDLVTLLVTVETTEKKSLPSLQRDEFELLEDGVPQKIESLVQEVRTPLRMVVLLDISSSVRNRLKFEQEATLRFFREVLRPGDQIAFYAFNHDVVMRQDMTGDLKQLEAATQGLKAKGGTAVYDAVYQAAQKLGRENGRRIIILVSDGSNTISRVSQAKAIDEVRRSEAVLYGIYSAAQTSYDNFMTPRGRFTLQALCNETGGRVFPGSTVDELIAGFGQLTIELRSQYKLSYYSNNDAQDGKFRKIDLRVKRPDLKVRTREGYFAPKN